MEKVRYCDAGSDDTKSSLSVVMRPEDREANLKDQGYGAMLGEQNKLPVI